MERPITESAWQRANRDTESFRKESRIWFWGVEVFGALSSTAAGGWIGFLLLPSGPTDAQGFWYPAIGGVVGAAIGLGAAFLLILLYNLFRAPYKQRDEARTGIAMLEKELDEARTQGVVVDGGRMEFSVKLESITYRSGTLYFDLDLASQDRAPWLMADISFRTNQPVQIASILLQMDEADPRAAIEPDSEAVQAFSLPHVLDRSETHRFQFQLSPEQAEGDHQLMLEVLAGGHRYTDGPHRINRRA